MSNDADYESGGLRIDRMLVYVIGGMGVAALVGAGVWWFYEALQNGLTPVQLGNIGAGMMVFAMMVLLVGEIYHDEDISLFGKEDDRDGFR